MLVIPSSLPSGKNINNDTWNTSWLKCYIGINLCACRSLLLFIQNNNCIFQYRVSHIRGKITSFQQQHDESVPEAWERFQDYILDCPHHGMESWLLMQTFYYGLSNNTRETMDAAAGGAFLSLTIPQAIALVEKMASNQGWNEERTQTRKKSGGMH